MNANSIIRQIVLDTETTGMNKFGLHYEGHRIIEIGLVEIINRHLTNKQFHVYLNPNRTVDLEAYQIHGISDQFLKDKPTFANIANDFLMFIDNSELIIHNAFFDLGFINYELSIFNKNIRKIDSYCKIIDTLKLAQRIFPGQRNSLDALCERYYINNDKRILHNALVDAQLLAHVFLSMTGGQTEIPFQDAQKTYLLNSQLTHTTFLRDYKCSNTNNLLKIIYANQEEKLAHEKCLSNIRKFNKYCK